MDALDRILSGEAEPRPKRPEPDARPRKGLAVLTCMDARIDPLHLLDLDPGDAHVLRNAGGQVTTDVLESLAMSQERLGTRSVVVIHHTHCAGLAARLPKQSVEASVRAAVRLLRAAPDLPHRDHVRGLVLDIERGSLRDVPTRDAAPAHAPTSHGPPLSRCLWCKRVFDPRSSPRRRARRSYCGDLCRLAARAGRPSPF